MASTIKEALSVVSEDQSLFECVYSVAQQAKPDMTASAVSEYGQSKLSPRATQQDWLTPPSGRVTIKMECSNGGGSGTTGGGGGGRVGQVNGSRSSPDDCSVGKGKMASGGDGAPMTYSSYMEDKHAIPPNMTTNERRVIVPADGESYENMEGSVYARPRQPTKRTALSVEDDDYINPDGENKHNLEHTDTESYENMAGLSCPNTNTQTVEEGCYECMDRKQIPS